MSNDASLSRRYATALVDAAEAASTLPEVAEGLDQFATLMEASEELRIVLTNPGFSAQKRQALLSQIAEQSGMPTLLARTLELLSERDRMDAIPSVARAVRHLADERARRVRADVRAASELSPTTLEQLKRALETRTGKTVDIDVTIEPALLGGIRAEVGSMVLDGTLRSQLDDLRESMMRSDSV